MPAFPVGTGLSVIVPLLIQHFANVSGKAANDSPYTHMKDLDEAPGS